MIAMSVSASSTTWTLDVLLPRLGSKTPLGTITLATFESTPVEGEATTAPEMVKVAWPAPAQFAGLPPFRLTVAFAAVRFPEPFAGTGQVPLDATQVQVAPV